MLWVFVGLAICELLVVHLFVALKWPSLGWPLTVVSGGTVLWLVWWIGTLARHPHELDDSGLHLKLGSLRTVHLPMADVARVESCWGPGEHRGRDVMNLVPVAYPNRMVVVRSPVPTRRGPKMRIAFCCDHPEAFDGAMRQRGVEVQA
jgi:hypothetical protein